MLQSTVRRRKYTWSCYTWRRRGKPWVYIADDHSYPNARPSPTHTAHCLMFCSRRKLYWHLFLHLISLCWIYPQLRIDFMHFLSFSCHHPEWQCSPSCETPSSQFEWDFESETSDTHLWITSYSTLCDWCGRSPWSNYFINMLQWLLLWCMQWRQTMVKHTYCMEDCNGNVNLMNLDLTVILNEWMNEWNRQMSYLFNLSLASVKSCSLMSLEGSSASKWISVLTIMFMFCFFFQVESWVSIVFEEWWCIRTGSVVLWLHGWHIVLVIVQTHQYVLTKSFYNCFLAPPLPGDWIGPLGLWCMKLWLSESIFYLDCHILSLYI